jgi:Holliday junction resolvase RusA-like endonuclease
MVGQLITITTVNPEPWAVGTANAGRRGGAIRASMSPNPKVQAYQEALREELDSVKQKMFFDSDTDVSLRFWFWREIETYKTVSGRQQSAHYADSTNLQKSTEDALQGLFFRNDSQVRKINSEIVAQGPDVRPGIVIHIEKYYPSVDDLSIVAHMQRIDEIKRQTQAQGDNSWG